MLDHLVIKFETFNSDGLIQSLREAEGVILIWNYAGEIKVVQQPSHLGLKSNYRFFTPRAWTAKRWIKWLCFFSVMGALMSKVLYQNKVKVFFVAGGDVLLWMAQIGKKLGRIERTMVSVEDWSLPQPGDDLFHRLNKLKLLLNDFVLNHLNTTVIVINQEIFAQRNAFWKNKTLSNTVLVDHQWAWYLRGKRALPERRTGHFICHLGTVRRDEGMNILFSILPDLNRRLGVCLKVIGPESELYQEYKSLSERLGLNNMIEWRGFIAAEALSNELADCFCGVNIQEQSKNASRYAIAGRVVHYLENFLVPIVSPHSGAIVKLLKDRQMGVVSDPTEEAITHAIGEAYNKNLDYLRHIDAFLSDNPYRATAQGFFKLMKDASRE